MNADKNNSCFIAGHPVHQDVYDYFQRTFDKLVTVRDAAKDKAQIYKALFWVIIFPIGILKLIEVTSM